MIFLCDTEGKIVASLPSTVNQGSISVNEVTLIAPFPETCTVTLTMKLPNGVLLTPRLVEHPEDENAFVMAIAEAFKLKIPSYNVWTKKLNAPMTSVAGTAEITVLITGEGGTVATPSAQINVNRTVPYIPNVDSADIDTIAQYLTAANHAASDAQDFSNAADQAREDTLGIKADIEMEIEAFNQSLSTVLDDYLTKTSADNTYLSKSEAKNTYLAFPREQGQYRLFPYIDYKGDNDIGPLKYVIYTNGYGADSVCVRDEYGNAEFNQRVTDDHALTMRNYGLTKDNRGVGQCVIFDYNKDYTLDLSSSDDYCGTYQIVGKYFDFYYKSKNSSTWTKISDVAIAQLNILRYYPHGVQAMWTSQLIMSAVF